MAWRLVRHSDKFYLLHFGEKH